MSYAKPARALALLTLPFLALACGGEPNSQAELTDDVSAAFSAVLTDREGEDVLRFVNDCKTTLVVLDVDARLDARAAKNIIAHRDGPRAECGGADSRPFDDLAELDAVPYVGDVALSKLIAHAKLLGFVEAPGGRYDGVDFTSAESEAVLAIVNGATRATLDDEVALDARAASAIVAARPYAAAAVSVNMTALADTAYVGGSALAKLKAHAPAWTQCPTDGGDYEGVRFSGLAVHDVLDLANAGTVAELSRISGIGPVLAGRIMDARPHADIPSIGAVSGVGGTVLGNLRSQVSTRWCPTANAACGCAGTTVTVPDPPPPTVPFDENGLWLFLHEEGPWVAERVVDSGFFGHDGTNVVFTDVAVPDDPDNWNQIMVSVFDSLWDCCFRWQFFGEPLEIGPRRRGTLHLGRIVNAHDGRPYVMAYWNDIDDASFAWLYEKAANGEWTQVGTVFLN